jgi:hypothetical protein
MPSLELSTSDIFIVNYIVTSLAVPLTNKNLCRVNTILCARLQNPTRTIHRAIQYLAWTMSKMLIFL